MFVECVITALELSNLIKVWMKKFLLHRCSLLVRAAPHVFSFALHSQRDRKFLLPSLLTLGSQTSKFWILLFRYASILATSSHEQLESVLFMLCPGCFSISRIFIYGCVCWIIAFVGAAPILQHVHQWGCFSLVCVRKIDWWEEGVRWAASRQSKGQDLCLIHSARGCTCTWYCEIERLRLGLLSCSSLIKMVILCVNQHQDGLRIPALWRRNSQICNFVMISLVNKVESDKYVSSNIQRDYKLSWINPTRWHGSHRSSSLHVQSVTLYNLRRSRPLGNNAYTFFSPPTSLQNLQTTRGRCKIRPSGRNFIVVRE